METLKILGHDEAVILAKIGPKATHGFLLYTNDDSDERVDGISFKECLIMEEAGILVATTGSIDVGYGTQDYGKGHHLLFVRAISNWALLEASL